MKGIFTYLIGFTLLIFGAQAQIITASPEFPTMDDEVTITFNATEPVTFKRLVIFGTGASTGFQVQTGVLRVTESIVLSGSSSLFQASAGTTVEVTGGG